MIAVIERNLRNIGLYVCMHACYVCVCLGKVNKQANIYVRLRKKNKTPQMNKIRNEREVSFSSGIKEQ